MRGERRGEGFVGRWDGVGLQSVTLYSALALYTDYSSPLHHHHHYHHLHHHPHFCDLFMLVIKKVSHHSSLV